MEDSQTASRCKFFTYLHSRADDGAVFYVGKGTLPRSESANPRSDWWKRVVAKHGLKVERLCVHTEKEALELEVFLISEFRKSGIPLVNLTNGGDGTSGYKYTDADRAKASAAQRGKKMHPETLKKLIAVNTGKAQSAESKEKKRLALLGRPRDIEVVSRIRSTKRSAARPFLCVENDKHFSSLPDAVEWLMTQGFPRACVSSVHQVLTGRSKTAYGYHFKRTDGVA